MNEGILQLMRVEEYLDEMSHEAAKAMCFAGEDEGLYEWYEDGHDEVSCLIDQLPLEVK